MSDTLNLSDPRSFPADRRRRPLAPFGNGKMRIALLVVGAVLNLTVTIVGASFVSGHQLDKSLAVIQERQSNQYGEVMRKLDDQKKDIDRLLNMLIEQRRR